jgi:hypothetical protein
MTVRSRGAIKKKLRDEMPICGTNPPTLPRTPFGANAQVGDYTREWIASGWPTNRTEPAVCPFGDFILQYRLEQGFERLTASRRNVVGSPVGERKP